MSTRKRSWPFQPTSYWMASTEPLYSNRPALKELVVADIAILGAGFTGLWTAYYLLIQNPGL
ncbi:MAG: hypothetical protein OWS74_06055, partial [Firmicutes bacterium]|nr:hypothetical protein [Bacillota bacterium]